MKNSKTKLAVLVFLILQLGAIGLARTTTNQIKTGKRDDITLSSVTKVGNLTLQPGQYILQHQMGRDAHAMHFVSFIPFGGAPGHGRTYYPSGPTGISDEGEAPCKFEMLKAKAEETRVYFDEENGVKRITRIEIKGENVAHVF
jgi:hypothetical protein